MDSSAAGLQFLSTSWSPPGWMKRGWLTKKGFMRNSAKPGMLNSPDVFASYALYFSKYLSAYKKAGVNVSMMTIQNEPDSADHQFPVAYPCNNFNGTGEGDFLRQYLGPQIRRDHPAVAILVHDGQKFHDVPILDRVEAIVAAAGGLQFVDGVAFHWYGNNLDNYQYLAALHAKYPQLPLLATEATLEAPGSQHIGTTPWKQGMMYAVDIIGDLNNGAEGWIEW
jgi:glucosylceramidase